MKLSEKQIRLALINYILYENNSAIVANEMRYAFGTKRADVVSLSDELTAFEIKSDFDSPDRFEMQINDYLKTFDKVYLVTSELMYRKHFLSIDRKVGILIFDGVIFFEKKKPHFNKKLSKIHIASSCNKTTLKKIVSNTNSKLNYFELVEQAVKKHTVRELRCVFHEEVKNKFLKFTNDIKDNYDNLSFEILRSRFKK